MPKRYSGPPPIDPTANVLSLVSAAISRVDDLREAQQKLFDDREADLRREMELRAEYTEKSLQSESQRLDALRDLDRSAVDTLAKSTVSLAETLRASVENTARNLAAQNELSKKELDSRISALERLQAAGSGKGAGLQAFWGYLVAASVFVGTIVALVSRFIK